MREEFEEMLEQLEAGKFVYVEPSSVMLEFNEFMASRGYSVARLVVVRVRGGSRTGRTFEYDFLANKSPGYEKEWQIFLDPQRSAANIRDIVRRALNEGGEYQYLVWAEVPPSEE
jgi:hypothetical protein